MRNDEDGLGAEYEKNSHRAHLAAYVLIAGLVAELIIAYFWYHGVETLLDMLATLLIVGGVWGEVHFGNKARVAGDKELAKFRARAAEAQLELERLKAPRHFEEVEWTEILKCLEPFEPQEFDISVNTSDPEAIRFASELETNLSRFGWRAIDWKGGMTVYKREGFVAWGKVHEAVGIVFQMHPESIPIIGPPAVALTKALRTKGLLAEAQRGIGNANTNSKAMHIFVGTKTA